MVIAIFPNIIEILQTTSQHARPVYEFVDWLTLCLPPARRHC